MPTVPAHRHLPPVRRRGVGVLAWIGSVRRLARACQPPGGELAGLLGACCRAALAAIAVLVPTASAVSFAESYRGLYEWAARHWLTGIWAAVWPLQVDIFIAVGELTLVVAPAYRRRLRHRAGAWAVTAAGLAVSVAGNVGHVTGHSLTGRGTAAIPLLVGPGETYSAAAEQEPRPRQPRGYSARAERMLADWRLRARQTGELTGSAAWRLSGTSAPVLL